MPAYLPDVLDRATTTYPDADPPSLERAIREAIAACGWEVAGDGEVYNPAEGAYRPRPVRVVARDQRFATRRRG